ncbi:MAG: cob(I)yrinic acid a,c-diamide adenosyltransferase [Rhodobacteraceae bacterium]|nr:cob(I)yrinic acid a,c-diamide adenosyltransferase [Paracoccaceae bacterium]
MVVLNKIYTRTGDGGETGLGDGSRTEKHAVRVSAYGTVDELNAVVGLARKSAAGDRGQRLGAIQNDLFDLGADLCLPGYGSDQEAEHPPLRISAAQVARLETEIDTMNSGLEALRSFVLPGGSDEAAALHLCRVVARRGERCMVELAAAEAVNPEALAYMNRLSDWFFVAARCANNDGKEDVLWIPGANRGADD